MTRLIAAACLAALAYGQEKTVTSEKLRHAGEIAGLEFTDTELDAMVRGATRNLRSFAMLRRLPLDNAVAPALSFTPFVPGVEERPSRFEARPAKLPEVERPGDLQQLAFADIATLAALIKSRQVSCVELATMFLERLRKLDETLECVVSFTEKRALEQARALDEELKAGKWRGLLHGIPYGAKDLFATKGYRTTWGARPFSKQVIDRDADVIVQLDEAGAVLIAKTTLGALAMGDVWFGGRTNNPWKPEQGSSGSSAGSAAATAAGGIVFGLGTETLGSIVSPSARCGCSALRPTFGRVSRGGAMALAWSMDKVGPICRSADDAAIVFNAIHRGDRPFGLALGTDVKGWKVGYFRRAAERMASYAKVLEELRGIGVELVEIRALPRYPLGAMRFLLNAEAAAAFDEITRDGRDDQLVRQDPGAWPNIFRVARLVPAVEYIQANRLRTRLMQDLDKAWRGYDFIVHPGFFGGLLMMTNLTGHPTAVAPSGFREDGTPESISFSGRLMWDDRLLALVQAWQRATAYHRKRPG